MDNSLRMPGALSLSLLEIYAGCEPTWKIEPCKEDAFEAKGGTVPAEAEMKTKINTDIDTKH